MQNDTHGQAAATPSENSASPAGALAPGQAFAHGRYAIAGGRRRALFADHVEATDNHTGHAVLLHLLRAEISASPEVVEAVVARARALLADPPPCTCPVLDAGSDGQASFVATAAAGGHTLAELLARKQTTGSAGFGARAGLNIAARLFAALARAHQRGVHGALTAEAVIVRDDGDVALTDLAFAPAVAALRGAGAWPEDAPLAPELAERGQATVASDIFAAGALAYRALVGSPPAPGCPRPSHAADGLDPAVDEIIARCMLPDPGARMSSASEVADALGAIGRRSAAQSVEPAPAAGQSLSQSLASAAAPAADDALQAALADTYERWLVTKDKLDYGPFSTAELVDQIRADQVLPGHVVIDNSTGERQPIDEHPLFSEVVDRARQIRDDRRRASAEETHTVRERRRGVALYGMIALGVLALAGGAYAIVDKLGDGSGSDGSASVAALDEEGQLQVTMSTPEVADDRPRRGRGGGRRGGGGDRALGYDDTQAFDLASGGGGTERLSNAQLNETIHRYGGRLGGCLTRTGSSRADIEFIVQGNGRVSGVRVNGETQSALASCISGVMRSMQFPTFDGPRTRGTFNIAL